MISKVSLSTLALLVLPLPALAHIALWDEAMFGWNDDPNQAEPAYPLADLSFDDWWLHGRAYREAPPKDGKFMELPSGGVYQGYTSCNKQQSKYGTIASERDATIYACKSSTSNPADGRGAMHTIDTWADPNPKDVKGTSIAIAYESDINKVTPEMFAVISVNYTSPWFQQTDYHIPGDLPPCPSGGCLCMWSWVHSVDGGSQQIYQLAYRCTVTGATGSRPLPAPQIAKKCQYPTNTSNCTVGAKQPHYWLQKERNNNHQDYYDPPFYNGNYGFMDGAQTDLYSGVPLVEETTSSAAPSSMTPGRTSSSPATSEAVETPTDTPTVPDATYTVTVTVVRPTASLYTDSSVASTTLSSTSLALNATHMTTSSAPVTTGTTFTSASTSSPTGKTCRRVRRRGTLIRRRRKSSTVQSEKRMFGGPAVPDIRVGAMMPAPDPTGTAVDEPGRDFRPPRRRATEAGGVQNTQERRKVQVGQLRSGRSVKF